MKKYDEGTQVKHIRSYDRSQCIVFHKTKEEFGGLSNMAAGFPLCVNGVNIRTSEALYQICRFPHLPEIQRKIVNEKSPMTAKMVSKPYRNQTRLDWDDIRVGVMRWCLRVKLAQNWNEFTRVILSTKDLPIVEFSRKDPFWGAKAERNGEVLVGMNVLGRLLMELSQEVLSKPKSELLQVEPMSINDFLIFGEQIQIIKVVDKEALSYKIVPRPPIENMSPPTTTGTWLSLFPA